MPNVLILVDDQKDWQPFYQSEHVITAQDYLEGKDSYQSERWQVINLCSSYRYLSNGYYCSLLAEARSHRVMPSVQTINDLSRKAIYSLNLDELESSLKKVERGSSGSLTLHVYFGESDQEHLQSLARLVFERFPCPILEVKLRHQRQWQIESIKTRGLNQLNDAEQTLFAEALDRFSHKLWRKRDRRKRYRYDLAVLVNSDEKLPPSDASALKKMIRIGRSMGIDVELIGRKEYGRLGEYDGLFIRETTRIDDHTYRFARKAELEGLVVIDDPVSILRCTNKVYLANLLQRNGIDRPESWLIYRDRQASLLQEAQDFEFPLVMKIPDGSFSRGVVKVDSPEDLCTKAADFFKNSAILLLQAFVYTDYDWRVGVFNNKALYACQYFMSRGHWQIYKHQGNKTQSGKFRTLPVHEAPKNVIKTALKATRLIGNGLYGVDIKEVGKRVMVIEVNDNPNIDSGVEDQWLGDELYRLLMEEFLRRFETKSLGMPARGR